MLFGAFLCLEEFQYEGGIPSVGFCFQEADAAVGEFHNLSGEGKTDSASFLFGGEEGDKNLFRLLFGDGRAVVAHVDKDVLFLGGVGADMDFPCTFSDGLYGIFYQVDEHLPDQVRVGIEHQVFRLYLKGQLYVGRDEMDTFYL